MLGDFIMSIGVIIASVIIYINPEWKIADPICTYVFSVIVCITCWPIVKECMMVLLEGSPDNVNVKEVYDSIKAIEGVQSVHDFHLWSITVGKHSVSAHVVTNSQSRVLERVTEMIK